jgi:hypothetical protein
MKIAVLGATGPTGIHLVTELCKTVATVRVVARNIDKLARLFPEAAVEKWEADIRDAGATLLAADGCDLVYDCIGLPGDQMHLHPMTARNIAGAMRHTKARCVQVSSYWAYYPQVQTEMNESHPRSGGPPWVRCCWRDSESSRLSRVMLDSLSADKPRGRTASLPLARFGAADLWLRDLTGPALDRRFMRYLRLRRTYGSLSG